MCPWWSGTAQPNVAKTVPLQDGTSVYIFQDGKMAMDDKFGRSVSMTESRAMVTRDGQSIRMAGNETARLDCIRRMQVRVIALGWSGFAAFPEASGQPAGLACRAPR